MAPYFSDQLQVAIFVEIVDTFVMYTCSCLKCRLWRWSNESKIWVDYEHGNLELQYGTVLTCAKQFLIYYSDGGSSRYMTGLYDLVIWIMWVIWVKQMYLCRYFNFVILSNITVTLLTGNLVSALLEISYMELKLYSS